MSVLQKRELLEALAATLMESGTIKTIYVRVDHDQELIVIKCDGVKTVYTYDELIAALQPAAGFDEWIADVIDIAAAENVVYSAGPLAKDFYDKGSSAAEFWSWFSACGFSDKDFGIAEAEELFSV